MFYYCFINKINLISVMLPYIQPGLNTSPCFTMGQRQFRSYSGVKQIEYVSRQVLMDPLNQYCMSIYTTSTKYIHTLSYYHYLKSKQSLACIMGRGWCIGSKAAVNYCLSPSVVVVCSLKVYLGQGQSSWSGGVYCARIQKHTGAGSSCFHWC